MKKKMFFRSYTKNSLSKARRTEDDPIVRNGLALTPADMNKMVMQGIPIGAQINAHFADDDFRAANDFDVPIQDRRGVDVAEVWEHSLDAKKKIRDYFSKAKREQTGSQEGVE